jgi:MFS family permease
MSEAASGAQTAEKSSLAYGWLTVGLLTIAYVFSFIDRYVLGLLIEPIKADLGLTDTQIGLLLGPAFAIFYATMGLPLGWLADRKNRIRIVAIGIAVWSVATAASGLARNFPQLFFARMSIGVGEATLSPCAMSIISDSFPPEKRSRPIAVYTMALSVGAGFASLLGAGVLTWAKSGGSITLPGVGELMPWQATFFIVGLPGLILSALFFLLREPPRSGGVSASGGNLPDMLKHVLGRWRMYGGFVSVFCFMTIVAYSQGWGAALFERTWGWEASYYASINGVVLIVCGPTAVLSAGWLCDQWIAGGKRDAAMKIASVGVLVTVLTGALFPMMPTAPLAMGVYALNNMGIGMTSAMGVTALLRIAPGAIKAQTVALYYMCISMAGLFLGPTAVALLNDHVFGVEGIRYSMAVIPVVFGVPVLLGMRNIMDAYDRGIAEHEGLT